MRLLLLAVAAAAALLVPAATSGAQEPFDPCAGWTTRVVASGLGSLENLEPDGSGGMLISASTRDAVERLLPDGTIEGTVASDMNSPGGLRVRDGELFANTGDAAVEGALGNPSGTIERIDLATLDRSTYASGIVMPNGLVFDGDGHAYTSRSAGADAKITKIPADDPGNPITDWADLPDSNGLAIDPTGEFLYVATTFNQPASVYRIALDDPTDIQEVAQLSGVGNALPKGLDDMTIDAEGILYLTANGSGELLRLDPTTGAACQITDALRNPSAVKFGAGPGWAADHLYVSAFDGRVVEVIPPGAGPGTDGGDVVRFEDFSCRARSWVAGTSELCDGVLTYHDYVYDDYGADLGTTGSSTGTLAYPAGDQRYPAGEPANTADLVDLSLRVVDDRLEVLAELGALYEPDTTLVVLAIDTDADATTGGGEWHGFGITSDGWEKIHVFTAADPLANLIGGSVPLPPGERWRLQAVAAQAEGPVMNVAFRGPDELARFRFRGLSGPGEGAWFEDRQAAALAEGDISAFGLEVEVADLTGGSTRPLTEVGPGLHERVYTSDVTLPPGEGMSYEGIGGRGSGGPTGAFGQVFHYFGRYQPYGLYLPDGPPPHALGMIYHGSNQNHSQLVNLPGLQRQVGDDANRILAAPLARGVHGYGSDVSERDLEDVEADVRAHYPVDSEQVIVAGYSQGGYVTFRQAALHPDRYAGLISWVGFTGDDTNPVATDLVTAGAVGNMFDFVGNYRHIPAALIYGAADELIPVTSSEGLANEFRRRGQVYAFFMHPSGDHFQFALLDEWGKEAAYVQGRTRAVDPPALTFRTADVLGDADVGVRHDEAYWVSQIRARERVDDHFAAEDAYVDVDLFTQGCGGETPVVEIQPGAGTDPIPWVSDEGVVVATEPIEIAPRLSGTLANVSSLAVDTAATCLTGAVAYELTIDGPTTVRLSDGRVLSLAEAGTHSGELPAGPAQTVERIAGPDRIGTSVAVSERSFDAAGTVLLARADDYADALAAGPLAALRGSPLLLTGRDALDERVADEIGRLGAGEVVLVGGEAALSEEVEEAVADLGVGVGRIAGADRFATAAEVARAVADAGGDTSLAYLVEGAHADPARGWPDAVAAGALAARQGRPLLLATRDVVPAATLDALAQLGATTVTAVGGEAAITWRTLAMAADPDGDGLPQLALHRLAGGDRYATSALVAERMLDHLATTEEVWLVTGRDWPDALTAGAAAAASGGVLLLVDGSVASGEGWLAANEPVEGLRLVGGEAVLAGP